MAHARTSNLALETPRSLYIHVPFCARRCSYCDFAVEAMRTPPAEDWLDCIARELELISSEQGWDAPLSLDTLYIGGGTPSLLPPDSMERLRERLQPLAVLASGAEWTCEANPESFDEATAAGWRRAGVNRLSMGVQTFDAGTLRWMGRLHGADGPSRAMQIARANDFENVSVDLIFGVPERLGRDWARDLEQAIELEPEHVSLYGLTAEAGAPLGGWVASGRETLADEDRYADEYMLAHESLSGAGFEHYEVSNFGRPGRRSRHNFVYWTGAPYAALGPGAHSYFPPFRRWNLRSWSAYRDALQDQRSPVEGAEKVDADASKLERIWLGLRTLSGIGLVGGLPAQRRLASLWQEARLASIDDETVRLTAAGWLLLDRLALDYHEAGGGRVPDPSIDAGAPLVQIAGNPKGSEE